jgi:hypothetical protein
MTDEAVTQEQLDEVAEALQPLLVSLLRTRDDQVLTLQITCTPLDPANLSRGQIMRWEVQIDGNSLTQEQEKTVLDFMQVVSRQFGVGAT